MGFVRAKLRIANVDNLSQHADLELLVDTGATFTLVPASAFRQVGAKSDTEFKLRLADGSFITRKGGTVWVELEGKGYRVPVIIGEDGDTPVVGVTTLEILGLAVDPVAGKLKPTDYLLL
ncbi:MAG: Retroviral aspartyl protease [Chloroflexi bacterium]|nr:Retroviral aspartyl protease [Chloroflexota bacterium]